MKNKLWIWIISLLLLSCATTKRNRTVSRSSIAYDSIVYKEIVRIDTFKISADSTKIILTPYMLKDTVWTYIEKTDGRSKLVIQRLRDTVYINAYCDSVIKLILNTEKTLFKQHSDAQINKETVTSKTSNSFARKFTAIVISILVIAVIVYVLIKSLI
ncbi:MAG: hypothetical protein RL135_1808 [Bacteroidota bacterium]|jgi:preprotein translocase subunit SecG